MIYSFYGRNNTLQYYESERCEENNSLLDDDKCSSLALIYYSNWRIINVKKQTNGKTTSWINVNSCVPLPTITAIDTINNSI
jgi:hypothetical protein